MERKNSYMRPVTPFRTVKRVIVGKIEGLSSYLNFRPEGSGDYLYIHTFEGEGLVTLADGSSFHLRRGHEWLYEPGALQDYGTHPHARRWHLYYSHFQPTPQLRGLLEWPVAGPGCRQTSADEEALQEVESIFHLAVKDQRKRLPFAESLLENHLERIFIWLSETQEKKHENLSEDSRINRALQFIFENPAYPHSVEELASRSSLSPSRFACLFKKQTGRTPRDTWEDVRMRDARNMLLHTNLGVGEIAHMVGFEDPFYFSTRFKRLNGSSPLAFRAKETD